jgi:hypothetical protein
LEAEKRYNFACFSSKEKQQNSEAKTNGKEAKGSKTIELKRK